MKEINLPLTTTYSLTVDMHAISALPVEEMDGTRVIPLGTVDIGEKGKEVEIARSNGGKILYATTSIEQKMEGIISHYIFGLFLEEHPERSFFENEILGASGITFNFKKDLLKKLVHKGRFLEGKKKHELERWLADIVKWRNAFAHGKLQYDNKQGCLLTYYSGGHQQISLDDAFWDKVTQTFTDCEKALNTVRSLIEQPHLERKGKTA